MCTVFVGFNSAQCFTPCRGSTPPTLSMLLEFTLLYTIKSYYISTVYFHILFRVLSLPRTLEFLEQNIFNFVSLSSSSKSSLNSSKCSFNAAKVFFIFGEENTFYFFPYNGIKLSFIFPLLFLYFSSSFSLIVSLFSTLTDHCKL